MDAWARLLIYQGLPLVPFLWRRLEIRGAWRLLREAPSLFVVRRSDPLTDLLLARATVPGPLFTVVESGRGLWSLRAFAGSARRVPFGNFRGGEAGEARRRALEECAHRLVEGCSVSLIGGGGTWEGERVQPIEDYAEELLSRCAELSLAPRVVPLRFDYAAPRLGAGRAVVEVGEPQSAARWRAAARERGGDGALGRGGGSGAPPEQLDLLAGLAALAAEVGGRDPAHAALPDDFEGRVRRARMDRPLEVRALVRTAKTYGEVLEGVSATDRLARRAGELPLLLRAAGHAALTLLGAAPALYGALANAPPLLAAGLLSQPAPRAGAPSPSQSRLLASALLLLPFYSAAGVLLVEVFGPWRGVALLLSLPVTGAWAMMYGRLARSFLRALRGLRRAPLRGGVAADLAALRGDLKAALKPLADLYGRPEGE